MYRFLLIAFCFFISNARAQLYFKNNTNSPVAVAIAMKGTSKSFTGWYTFGWYKVSPNERLKVSDGIGLNDYVYYYAVSLNDQKYTGNNSFLVNPKDNFNIRNADMQYMRDSNPDFEFRKFREVKMNSTFKLKYTIELNY